MRKKEVELLEGGDDGHRAPHKTTRNRNTRRIARVAEGGSEMRKSVKLSFRFCCP